MTPPPPRRGEGVREGGALDGQREHDGDGVGREMGRDEVFHSVDEARRLPGYEPQHSWRDVLDDPRGGA